MSTTIIETYLAGLLLLALGLGLELGVHPLYVAFVAVIVTTGTVIEDRRERAARAAFKAAAERPPAILPDAPRPVVHINVNGALDPVEVGRQIEEILRRRGGGPR